METMDHLRIGLSQDLSGHALMSHSVDPLASHLLNESWAELTTSPGTTLNAGGLIRVREGQG